MADQSRIYFNSNINVDVVKVTKDTSLTLQDAITQRKKMGKKPLLYNDFIERVEAEYFPPLAKDREAQFNIYRKTPDQKYYDYVCGLTEDEFAFVDYKIKANQWYHYLAAAQVYNVQTGIRYLMFENKEDSGDLTYLKVKWDNWSIQDIEDSDTEGVYIKTGSTWLLGLNLNQNSVTQNTNVMNYETLGKFSKYGVGEKSFQSGSFSSLLGQMAEVTEYRTINDVAGKSNYRYTERDNPTYKFSAESNKLDRWREFIYNGKLKLLKDFKGNAWIVQIMSNPTFDINYQANEMPTTISFEWQEAEDFSKVSIIAISDEF